MRVASRPNGAESAVMMVMVVHRPAIKREPGERRRKYHPGRSDDDRRWHHNRGAYNYTSGRTRRSRIIDRRWRHHDTGRWQTDGNVRQRREWKADANVNLSARGPHRCDQNRCEQEYFFHMHEQTGLHPALIKAHPLIVLCPH